jgi:bacterioferritin (cytochrome b1)
MPDQKLLSLAMEAREHAKEALTLAETFGDAEARRIMRDVAESYEKLAEKLEQHARDVRRA